MPRPTWLGGRRQSLRGQLAAALKSARSGDQDKAVKAIREPYGDAYAELLALSEQVDTGWLRLAALLLFRAGRMAEAAGAADRVVVAEASDADSWNLLARIRLWLGDPTAGQAFARAAALDPQRFVRPLRVSQDRFTKMAEQALAAIPAQFQAMLENTLIVVDALPPLATVAEGEDPDLLGLYEGATALEHGLPERIVLYQRNHENLCALERELRRLVEETMRHELGHHFGMEEDELPY